MCCGSWGPKESEMTERLNWNWTGNSEDNTIMDVLSHKFGCAYDLK